MRELCGFGAVNYKEIYGFSACKGCGDDVHVYIDKRCKSCGTPVVAETKAIDPTRKKSAIRWSAAYYRTCEKQHEYPMKLKTCPHCSPDPNTYMAQVAKATGGGTGPSYTPKNWFARGR
jgi:rRNA maturation protein Nop10